jgi:anti-anti-sigma factor
MKRRPDVVAEQLPSGVTLVRVKGALNRRTADLARQLVEAIGFTTFGPVRVLLDLAEVVFVDNAGLDAIFGLQTRVALGSGSLELQAPPWDVVRLLHDAAISDASWRPLTA